MARAETPGAADKLIKYLRALFNWAIGADLATFNPVAGVTKIHKSAGFHTWSEAELAHFRDAYPVGSMARLAMELMLNLGVRRSDLVKLGWKNLIGERIEFSPLKGAAHHVQRLSLPVTDELREALDAMRHDEPTFLVTEYSKAFSSNGFGNKMRQWCNNAGLPECSSHGLRKSSATILAEAGATEHQLMAIFGWSDSKMAQHYTKAAQSKLLIDAGFDRRKSHVARKNVPLSSSRNSGETNRGKNDGKTTSEDGIGGPGGTGKSALVLCYCSTFHFGQVADTSTDTSTFLRSHGISVDDQLKMNARQEFQSTSLSLTGCGSRSRYAVSTRSLAIAK